MSQGRANYENWNAQMRKLGNRDTREISIETRIIYRNWIFLNPF